MKNLLRIFWDFWDFWSDIIVLTVIITIIFGSTMFLVVEEKNSKKYLCREVVVCEKIDGALKCVSVDK